MLILFGDNRTASYAILAIVVGVIMTFISSFILYNFVDPSYDSYSVYIGTVASILTFMILYNYGEKSNKRKDAEINEEAHERLQMMDFSRCLSCTKSLSLDSNYCPSCGFDNGKIKKKALD